MKQRERVLELSSRIMTLREQKTEIDEKLSEAEHELDSLIGKRQPRAGQTEVATEEPYRGSVADRAEKILKRAKRPLSIPEIHAKMSDAELPTLRSALVRLSGYEDALIHRAGWGMYEYRELGPKTD